MADLTQEQYNDLKKQGFTDDLISKMQVVKGPQNPNVNNTENIIANQSLNKILQSISENLEKNNAFLQKLTKDKKSDKIFEDVKKSSVEILKSSKLFNNEIVKSAQKFGSVLATKFAPIIDALKIVQALSIKQAEMNKSAYLTNQTVNSFWNTAGLKSKVQIETGMGGREVLDDERIQQYQTEFAKTYDILSPRGRNQIELAQIRSGLSTALGARGVSEDVIQRLTENLFIKQGRSGEEIDKRLFRLMQSNQLTSGLSPQKFYSNLNNLIEQGTKFGLTLEDAIGLLAKFGKQIDKGTISLSNLTAYSNTLSYGSVSQNAGLGAMLYQTGNLPAEALKYIGNPLSLGGWLRANSTNMQLQRGLENMVRGEASSMGLTDKYSLGEYFRMRYSSFGLNLDKEQYEKLARGGSLTKQDIETATKDPLINAINDLTTESRTIYTNTTDFKQNFEDMAKIIKDSTLLKIGRTAETFGNEFNQFDEQGRPKTSSTESVGGFGAWIANHIIAAFRDIAKMQLENDRIRHQAMLDSLHNKSQEIDVTGKVKAEVNAEPPNQ